MKVIVKFNRITESENPMKGPVVVTSVEVQEDFDSLPASEQDSILKDAVANQHAHLYRAEEVNILKYE